MIDVVFKSIDRFYRKKDYISFKAYCEKSLELFVELKFYIEKQGLILIEGGDLKDSPSRRWRIIFNDFKKNDFEVSYNTILQVSKVAPLFHIQHEFSVNDIDVDRMTSKLGGFGVQPYTKKQYELHDEILKIFGKYAYYELGMTEMDEVVEGFKMPEGVTIFGPNVTVELLLFVDVFDICNK